MGENMTGILSWISHFSVEATHFKLPVSRLFLLFNLKREKGKKENSAIIYSHVIPIKNILSDTTVNLLLFFLIKKTLC